MPWIHRRAVGRGLLLVRGVPHHVVKFSIRRGCPDIQLVNRVSRAIPRIARSVRIASVGRFRHQDAQKSHGQWSCAQLQGSRTAFPIRDHAARKSLPHAARGRFDRIVSGPILNDVVHRVWLGPLNLHAGDLLQLRQVHHNPLRMERIAFTRKFLRQIWIALPVAGGVSIRQPRKSGVVRAIVARESAMRQRVTIRIAQKFRGVRRPGKISVAARIAPCPLRIPMPCFHRQFRILAEAHRLPARAQRSVQCRLHQILIDGFLRNAVHTRAQRLIGREVIRCVPRRDIHLNGLGRARKGQRKKSQKNCQHGDCGLQGPPPLIFGSFLRRRVYKNRSPFT